MEWLTNELMFYGGIAVAGGSAVLAVLCFCVSQFNKVRLNIQLDAEYGKINTRRK